MNSERERVKLDVIIALKTKLQDVYEGEGLESIPLKFSEKLNSYLLELVLEEVTKVKREEET